MAGRIIVPDLRAFDNSGDPISGALLHSYATGTTTNLALYSDSALTTEHTNPVVADAYGRFPTLWAAADVAYRIKTTNAAGSLTLSDIDPVVAQGTGTNPAPASKSNAYAVATDDQNRALYLTGTWALTLPLGSTLVTGFRFRTVIEGAGTITATASGGDLIGSAATKALGRGAVHDWEWNGSIWKATEVTGGAGRHALWVPNEAMIARLTNGPGATISETATNKLTRRTLDFDASTIEYAQFRIVMPKSWDEGTVTFQPVWLHGATATNFGVSWGMQAVAMSDGDAGDAAFGTAIYTNDTGGTTGTIYKAPESAAITIAGTPAAEDLVAFQVLRKADDGTNDTLAVDASLLGVVLFLNTDAGSDV